MKNITIFFSLFALTMFWFSCGGAQDRQKATPIDLAKVAEQQAEVHGNEIKEVKLTNPLDATMAKDGKGTYELKCSACHKLTDEKLVGPGWKGVTKKRQPVWIMNMITNVEMMLDKDPEAQKLLELCLVRMPNQNLTEAQARSIVEFMRQNDGEK